MTLAEALNVYFNPDYLKPVPPGELPIMGPEHRGDLSASTREQYDRLEWNDKRPKPKWDALVPIMALPSPKETMAAHTIEARLTALEHKTANLS